MKENEIKAQWMAQYYGQNILRWHQWVDTTPNSTVDFKTPMRKTGIDNGWFLHLRSISQLTDEEYTIVGTLTFPGLPNSRLADKALETGKEIIYKQRIGYSVYRYLQLIGVLAQFVYLDENNIPVTLQPDEIIAKGWAKIQDHEANKN